MSNLILQISPDGLYCPAGDFYIDPWNPVPRAVITHSHSDHAQPGCGTYLTSSDGEPLLRSRIPDARIETIGYGETRGLNGVHVSLHPAGHVLGSVQVRIEHHDEVWVASGDYQLGANPTCLPFEPLRCHTFITESTFGLPIYRWPAPAAVFNDINQWWRANQERGKASIIFGHALGKAQRILAGVDLSIGPIFAHGAVRNINRCYRESGMALPNAASPNDVPKSYDWTRVLIIAPLWAHGSPWSKRFGPASTAFASGWMRIRGTRRRRAIDRGFVLSDHADWPALLEAIRLTEAERVWVTHGYRSALARWVTEQQGREAQVIDTRWENDELAESEPPATESPANESPANGEAS